MKLNYGNGKKSGDLVFGLHIGSVEFRSFTHSVGSIKKRSGVEERCSNTVVPLSQQKGCEFLLLLVHKLNHLLSHPLPSPNKQRRMRIPVFVWYGGEKKKNLDL